MKNPQTDRKKGVWTLPHVLDSEGNIRSSFSYHGSKLFPMKYPVFKCIPGDYDDGMKFFCPYCHAWHEHGRINGHRLPHCNSDSPLQEHGYIVRMMTKPELKKLTREIAKYLKGDQP